MWAKLEEAWRTHTVERNQPEKQICQTSPCKYCGSSHPPQRCPAYGKRCGEFANMNTSVQSAGAQDRWYIN